MVSMEEVLWSLWRRFCGLYEEGSVVSVEEEVLWSLVLPFSPDSGGSSRGFGFDPGSTESPDMKT